MTTRTVPATEQRSLAERFHISSSAVLVGIIVVEIIFFSAVQPAFLTATNLLNAARASSVMGIVAIGVTFGLISGAVDLSNDPAQVRVGFEQQPARAVPFFQERQRPVEPRPQLA